jgi:impB/mucB/samB family C-terminal domain
MVSRSFGRIITALTEMREAVATYTTRAAEKLRRAQRAAGVLTVFLTTNRFTDEPQYANRVTIPLRVATQDTAELIRYALRGIEQIFHEGYRYKKAGVILTALVPAHQVQTHLFEPARSGALAAVDGSARCDQYAVGGWDRTLCVRGLATTMDHAMWTWFTAVYHAMGRVGRGAV